MGERLRADLQYLDGIIPFLCALGCARAWVTLTAVAPVYTALPGFDFHLIFDVSYSAFALVIALVARKITPISTRKTGYFVSFGLMFLSSLCCIGSLLFEGGASVLSHVTALLGGVGFSLFLLLWAEILSCVSLFRIFLYTTASQVFGAVCVFFCNGLDELRCSVAVLVLPVAAVFCLRYAYHKLPEQSRPKKLSARFSYPWKLFALLALFSFVYGMREQQLVAGAGVHSSLSTALLMAFLFVVAFLFREKLNISMLYRSPIVLMVCGFLLIPAESVLGTTLSSYLVAMSHSLVTVLVALLIYDISKRMGVAIVIFTSVKQAMQIFTVFGEQFGNFIDSPVFPFGVNDALVTGFTAALVLIAGLLLLSERELSSKWGVRILEEGSLSEQSNQEEFLEKQCSELACRYRLSPREEEILRLLAKGKTGPEIEKELCIAEGTFKAHSRHIYEKMGINTRKQLKELVDAQHS